MGNALRRHFALERFRLPPGPTWRGALGSLLVPGFGFYSRGPRLVGIALFGVCLGLLLLFFAAIGYPLANVAFGLLLSVHATSAVYGLEPLLAGLQLPGRILLTLALLLALTGLVYLPARSLMEARWLAPLQVKDRVFVVQKFASVPKVKRNDWIAYTIPGDFDHNAWVEAGVGLGPVLAIARDHVRFTKKTFEVNGVAQRRLANMPEAGELVVPEKHWLVWPDFAISGHGQVAGVVLATVLLQKATITEEQFAGKPFKRWFWRRQIGS